MSWAIATKKERNKYHLKGPRDDVELAHDIVDGS